MCCFSGRAGEGRELRVWGTRIFARALENDRQALVYQMSVATNAAVAMILPLPVIANPPENAVDFVSLEGYADFFDDLQKLFPTPAAMPAFAAPQSRAMAMPKLVVHQVGSFVASFVPRVQDFDRLDERFRMPPGVFDKLPRYRDWGFAVFQLKDFDDSLIGKVKKAFTGHGSKEEKIHPMAFTFPRRDAKAIFFPTVHVHDGEVHERAHFDHTLYLQQEGDFSKDGWWAGGMTPAQGGLDVARAKGLLAPSVRMQSKTMHGSLKNDDTWVRLTSPIDAAA